MRELRFTFSRSSGPGGQHVNKVNTKATLCWAVYDSQIPDCVRSRFIHKYHSRITKNGEIYITSQRFRDQSRNVADCLSKLNDLLASVAEPDAVRKPTRPTLGSVTRRLDRKRAKSAKKRLRRPPSLDD